MLSIGFIPCETAEEAINQWSLDEGFRERAVSLPEYNGGLSSVPKWHKISRNFVSHFEDPRRRKSIFF